MRTTKQLQRFYMVEVFRTQPLIPGSQGSETVSLPFTGRVPLTRSNIPEETTVCSSKGQALHFAYTVSTIFFTSKPGGYGWSIHRGEKMKKSVTAALASALLACLAMVSTAQEKKIKSGLTPEDWAYKMADGVTAK